MLVFHNCCFLSLVLLVTLINWADSSPAPEEPCECVDYYQCVATASGTVYNVYGEGLLDIRFGEKVRTEECPKCHSVPQICCRVSHIDRNVRPPDTFLPALTTIDISREELHQIKPKPQEYIDGFGNQGAVLVVPESETATQPGSQHQYPYPSEELPLPVYPVTPSPSITDQQLENDKLDELFVSIFGTAPSSPAAHPEYTPADSKYRTCGLQLGLGVRIMGGRTEDLPWFVKIFHRETSAHPALVCGGSLITERVVLTAAHCVDKIRSYNMVEYTVKVPHGQEVAIYDVKTHPRYNPKNLQFDVGLIILESAVHIGEEFGTGLICLPSSLELPHPNQGCFATGFDHNAVGMAVVVPLVKSSTCQDNLRRTRLGRHFILHDSFVCAGGEKNEDTCKIRWAIDCQVRHTISPQYCIPMFQGDGGSPLICKFGGTGHDAFLAQVGAVSWGIGCGQRDIPGVYASTAIAKEWIDEQVRAAGYDPAVYTY